MKTKTKLDIRVNCEEHIELESEKGKKRLRRELAKEKDWQPRQRKIEERRQSYIRIGVDPDTGKDL